ncbi:MAG: zinc-binding dehydrogenase [Pseudomonadales bacterium]
MKALQYQGPGAIAWIDVSAPVLQEPDDVIIKPLAIATCDLDWEIIAGRTPFPAPFLLGHEFVGEVMAAGAGVRTVKVGERVAVAFQPGCGHCNPCDAGVGSACKSVPPTSMFGVGAVSGDWGGAFAEAIRVPYADNMLVPLPDSGSATRFASASDNVADALRTVAGYVAPGRNDRVLILGGYDSIPLYAVACARTLGAGEVTFCTKDARAAANAAQLGASVQLLEQWPKRFAASEVTVCAVHNEQALLAAIRSTAAGGHCTSVSIFAEDVALPLREMYMRGIHFHTGRVESVRVLGSVLQWISSGDMDPLSVDTAVVPFAQLIPALLDRPAAKVIAVPVAGQLSSRPSRAPSLRH